MRKLFTKTFFTFLFGFVAILAVSFALIVAAGLASGGAKKNDRDLAVPATKTIEP